MAERVAGIGARDAEDEQALIWANAMTGVADDLYGLIGLPATTRRET
jgi:hypothetical protein